MVPIITGALGTVSKDIEKWLVEIGVTCMPFAITA